MKYCKDVNLKNFLTIVFLRNDLSANLPEVGGLGALSHYIFSRTALLSRKNDTDHFHLSKKIFIRWTFASRNFVGIFRSLVHLGYWPETTDKDNAPNYREFTISYFRPGGTQTAIWRLLQFSLSDAGEHVNNYSIRLWKVYPDELPPNKHNSPYFVS